MLKWNKGEWVLDDDPLPDGLRLVDGDWRAADNSVPPVCFGVMWDGVGVGCAEECKKGCDFTFPCCELTAKQALPEMQAQMGADHSLAGLAEEMGISGSGVLALTQYQRGGKHPLTPLAKREKSEKAPEPTAPGVVTQPKKKPPPSESAKTQKAKALSAKRAKGGAKRKKPAPLAPTAKALAAPTHTGTKPWGEETFRPRFDRERERNEWVACLRPGDVIQREFKGQLCELQVHDGYYMSRGRCVATTYMAAILWTGVTTLPATKKRGARVFAPFSGPRFWRIKAAVQEHGLATTKPRDRGDAPMPVADSAVPPPPVSGED